MPSAKIAGKLPKGDRDGLNPVAEIIREQPGERRLFIVVAHATKVEHITEDDEDVVTLGIDQIELVDRGADYIDAAMVREILLRSQQRRNGRRILPFELRSNLEDLFPNLVTNDEREEREDEDMTAEARLRRHLERVHGYSQRNDEGKSAEVLTDAEAAEFHRTDHEHERINHPTSFTGWTGAQVAELPRYLLSYSTSGEVWQLLDRAGRAVASKDLPGTDVDPARGWAAEQIEMLTGAEVLRWHNSEIIDGAWVPVIDDQVQKQPQSDSAGSDPQGDPTLFDTPDSSASGSAGQADGVDSPEAPPATTGDSLFDGLLRRMARAGVEITDEAVMEGMRLADQPQNREFVAENLDRLVKAGKIEAVVNDGEPGRVIYIPAGFMADADESPEGSHGGSPHESSDPEQTGEVPAAVFSAPEPEGGVDLDSDTRPKRRGRK